MSRRESIDKRVITLRHSDSSLTSKRVSIILSSQEDGAKLAKAVRMLRLHKKANFKLSKGTEEKIRKEKEKLESD